jgi:hypothetical protein
MCTNEEEIEDTVVGALTSGKLKLIAEDRLKILSEADKADKTTECKDKEKRKEKRKEKK